MQTIADYKRDIRRIIKYKCRLIPTNKEFQGLIIFFNKDNLKKK